ncbi:lysine--tRNA ligase [Nocardioides sp.]|uniref:lysine--tRNA ligase n=1 Tax=Nocardioides sp. TaxID=35761 RepID=UPI001A1A95A1|nr:lysine--tRNA ligase [Nocardioides sp.]MBJ7356976.1 lysine--tRNA ligase [Nocardioides sp.]
MPTKQDGEPHDWVTRAADDAVRHAGEGAEIVTVSSGASPSGRVHLGNLREFLTVHFVAEELRRRGVNTRHLHVWDDFDRFRKVPVGVDPSWSDHIGRPLSAVPDPEGCHDSWAEHFKAPLRDALHAMGVDMEEISQTERYRAGHYRDPVLTAVRERHRIESVLAKHRTKAVELESADDDDTADTAAGDLARFPYKPYCRDCGRDTVTLTSYDEETTDLGYTCDVTGYQGVTNLTTDFEGKLVWKVDWPMRWAVEHVDFEPAGMDHATPGSSFTVGHELVESIYGMPRPAWFGYGFVGFAGVQKMSSSAGGAPTAEDALRILEAPILRWLYVRRNPRQAFNIDFGAEVVRLYDEWDALGRKAQDPAKRDAQVLAYERATSTSTAGVLPTAPVVVPFRLLSSVADVTAGSAEQISRIVEHAGHPHGSVADLQPRLDKAMAWTSEFVPESDRTTVRDAPDTETLAALGPQQREWIGLLLQHLPDEPDLEPLTAVVYGVPKLARGMALDDKPTDEVKADQKEFFALLYQLLVDAERGPRLPTLILALGSERVRDLLTLPE